MPAIHVVQTATFVPLENLPASQLMHELAPLYWPLPHTTGEHALEPVAVATVHALHDAQEELPAAEYVFAGQLAQVVAPGAEETLPAVQLAHWVPPGVSLKVPAAHVVQLAFPEEE